MWSDGVSWAGGGGRSAQMTERGEAGAAGAPRPAAADYPVLMSEVGEPTAVASFPYGTVFVFDHDLRYTHVGGDVLTSLGRDRTQYVGRTLREMFDDEAVASREPAYRQALAGENVVLDAPLNGNRVLEMHLSPLFDARGAVVAVLGYSLDVTELRGETRTLLDSREQFRLAFEKAPIGIALARVDGMLFRVNSALCRILATKESTLVGSSLATLLHPDEVSQHEERVRGLLRGEAETVENELRCRRPDDDSDVWVLLTCTLVRSADTHSPSHLIAQITDISERRTQHAEIVTGHAFQAAVLAASPDLIHIREVDRTEMVWTSRSILDMLGYSQEHISELGPALYDTLIPIEDRRAFDAASLAAQGLDDGQVSQVRHRVLHADGTYRWLSRRLTPFLRDDAGRVMQLLGVSRDITDSVALEDRLEHAALHDELTGLPNRRLLQDRITKALTAKDPKARTAVLFCDLDGFKDINDLHGHTVGDHVLTEVAARLLTTTREGDTVSRLGGDAFVVVLRVKAGEDPTAVAQGVAGRIRSALAADIPVGEGVHRLTVSIGVAIPAQDGAPDDVLRDADHAMYQAKLTGKDRHVVFGTGEPSPPRTR